MITDTPSEKGTQYTFFFQKVFLLSVNTHTVIKSFEFLFIQKVITWNTLRQMKIVDVFTIVAISLI